MSVNLKTIPIKESPNYTMSKLSRVNCIYFKSILNLCFDNCVSQYLSGAGSSPAGSVGRDLNLQKFNYQSLTTSVAVVLVVR